MEQGECPIFKALGLKSEIWDECADCPLTGNCPYDNADEFFDITIRDIIKAIQKEKGND